MPEAFAVGGLLLLTLPAAAILAAVIAIWLIGWIANHGGIDGKRVRRLVEAAIWSGLLAARAAYVVAHWTAYRDTPWSVLYLWEPGYSLVSGVVAAFAYLIWRLVTGPRTERGTQTLALLGGDLAGGRWSAPSRSPYSAPRPPAASRRNSRWRIFDWSISRPAR